MRILALRQSSICFQANFSRKLHLPPVVDCQWLQKEKENVKIVVAAFTMTPKADHNSFLVKDYGDFERLMKEKVNSDYTASHIPNAVHFNLDVGNFPGRYARFGIYPPKVFETYMQLLGLNNYDNIVIYGRGPAAGMLFASRVWWTLKLYGHNAVSVLDGGFEAWKEAGLPVSSEAVNTERGTWKSNDIKSNRMVDFDDLTSEENGTPLLDKLKEVNFLDTRVRDQFTGKIPQEFPAKNATGYRITGAKNVPISDILTTKGLKSKEEVDNVLKSVGFDAKKPTYLMCNRAIQAALVNLALERSGHEGKVYNGSMEELAARASHFITDK